MPGTVSRDGVPVRSLTIKPRMRILDSRSMLAHRGEGVHPRRRYPGLLRDLAITSCPEAVSPTPTRPIYQQASGYLSVYYALCAHGQRHCASCRPASVRSTSGYGRYPIRSAAWSPKTHHSASRPHLWPEQRADAGRKAPSDHPTGLCRPSSFGPIFHAGGSTAMGVPVPERKAPSELRTYRVHVCISSAIFSCCATAFSLSRSTSS
jgi:hypothetical protein